MLTNRNIYFDFTSFSNRHFSDTKICKNNESDCQYISTAPGILRTLVSPHTLVIALLTIAAGI